MRNILIKWLPTLMKDDKTASQFGQITLGEDQKSFGIEVYKQIRTEVWMLLSRIENPFRYSLIASATVFAWLVTKTFGLKDGKTCVLLPKEALEIAWVIPPAFILLSRIIVLATYIRISDVGLSTKL